MKPFIYFSIAVISFLSFVVAFVPASPVWSLVREDVHVQVPDLNVYRVSGTIWEGESELQFRQFPPSLLSWQLSPFALFSGIVVINASAVGNAHSLQAVIRLTNSYRDITSLQGTISSDYINALSEQYGITFSGELEITDLSISSDKDRLTDASGKAHWTGGRILLSTAGQPQSFELPPLDGLLSVEQQTLSLNITHQLEMLLNISLDNRGWAKIALKGRMFELAGLTLPEGSELDQTILLIEEKIL